MIKLKSISEDIYDQLLSQYNLENPYMIKL